jgi:uncharacterized protein YkwD
MKNNYIAKAGSTALATLIIVTGLSAPAQAATTPSPNAIDTYSRATVATAYANKWLPTTNSPINWTGDAASCQAGAQSVDSLAKGAQAVNFYRGLVGLDSISFTSSQNTMAQQTALLMEANGQISHTPSASWKCYTDQGAQGAATSNLHGGAGSYTIKSASAAIESYMDEPGANNAPVGHRRWILNPSTVTMGMGTTKGFNALNIYGAPTDTSRTNPTMIGFPGSGYFPQQLEPNGKWSLSSAQGVDFSGAKVSVKDANGIALGIIPLSTAEGYGPNTISFQVQGLSYASGTSEAVYKVTVDNIKKNNLPFSYSYTVRLFDGNVSTSSVVPADPMPTLPTPVVTVVPKSPTFGTASYTIPATAGVVYKVNGVAWQAGTYNASTPITITAEASSSAYAVTGATSWSKDFTPIVVQPIVVTPTAPTFTATTYTIPYQDGVDYKVNGGSSLQGTYNAAAPISITAVALSGYKLTGTTTWSKDFSPVTAQPIQVTPVAPTLGATSYTIPTVTGVNYLVGGNVKPAGTYNANTNVTITALAKTGYVLNGTTSWNKNFTPAPVANPSIKAVENFIAADPSGDLWDYGDFTAGRRLIDFGWKGYTNLNVVDWNKDGIADIIAKSPSGTLYFYKGLPAGGFSRMSLGDGWGPYDVYVGSWIKGSKYPSVIARNNNTGELFHYANESGTTFSKRVLFDTGWNGYGIHITDWDKDGNADIVAKSPAGQMLVYRTDGNNNLIREKHPVIGLWGWNDFSIKTIRNFRGSNTDGIIARRNNDGALYYYQNTPSGLAAPIQLGLWGWNDYNIANK